MGSRVGSLAHVGDDTDDDDDDDECGYLHFFITDYCIIICSGKQFKVVELEEFSHFSSNGLTVIG